MNKDEEKKDAGQIRSREIVREMEESYIDYAMSVIISRALPDVRDGLKPVQRRILYTMYEDGLFHNSKFKKSATVVGNTMAKYHPHGDVPLYGSLVRMAQDFSLRYVLVGGQGNMGSIDDPSEFAAMRYTECRLSQIGQELLKDIEKNTVDFRENYDGSRKEPVVLPSPLPQLLLNGSMGIAVGMATNIPPHNLSELCEALIYLIENPDTDTHDLFRFIKGPDFPTGGIIYDRQSIITTYSQGKGSILIRGRTEILEKKGGFQIVISEIPFGVQKSALIQQIAKLIEEDKIKGVRDLRDESDREGLRVVIDLKSGTQPKKIQNQLYKWSGLQASFHLNMLALVEGIQPRVLSLAEALGYFLTHRQEIIFKRTKFDLEKAREKAHILEGLQKAISKIDLIIKTIRASENRQVAEKNLIQKFKLTKLQANAILEMKLSSLAKLEREKIQKDLKDTQQKIRELSLILKSPKKVKEILKKELQEYKEKFKDARRTQVLLQKTEEITPEDLIPKEPTIVILTHDGFIKRMHPSVYRVQKRGGKGILGMKTKEEDVVGHLIFANTHDSLLFFTDSGKVFKTQAFEIPEVQRTGRGKSLTNFLEISSEEKVLSCVPVSKEEETNYIVMSTRNGIIKKTNFSDFKNVRKNGLIAISLKKEDLLTRVGKSSGDDEVVLITRNGQSVRFKEKGLRPMGRAATGVRGIRLKRDDEVVGMEIIKSQEQDSKKSLRGITKSNNKIKNYLLTITENGFGKQTDVKWYRLQSRGGTGIKAAKINSKTGKIVATRLLTGLEKFLILISQKGQVIKIEINSISKMNRATQGVKIMKLGGSDKVASIACI